MQVPVVLRWVVRIDASDLIVGLYPIRHSHMQR
jgi:hypothetical protein